LDTRQKTSPADEKFLGSRNVRELREFPNQLMDMPFEQMQEYLGRQSIIRLSMNESPYGPSPDVSKIFRSATNFHRYPDANALSLRKQIASLYGTDINNVVVSNGAEEMIFLICQTFLDLADEVIIPYPTFEVYIVATKSVGAIPKKERLGEYTLDLEKITKSITPKTKAIFLCNPNNPTGTMVSLEALRRLFEKIPSHIPVVVDEAYIEYSPQPKQDSAINLIRSFDNVAVIRTFSKIYGLAGMRVGYMVGDEKLVNIINRLRAPFNVSHISQFAAEVALSDQNYIAGIQKLNAGERSYLQTGLNQLGCKCVPSYTNFILVDVGMPSKIVFNHLVKNGIIVRPCSSYGLENHLRVTIGTRAENEAVVQGFRYALEELRT